MSMVSRFIASGSPPELRLYPLVGGGLRIFAGRLGADGDLLAHRAISINSAMTASISEAAGPVASVS